MAVPEHLLRQLSQLHGQGVFSAVEAGRVGVSGPVLARWVARGIVLRVIHGWYVLAGEPGARPDRHDCVLAAVLAAYDGAVVASHHSALRMHGLPVFGCPDEVHVTHRRRPSIRIGRGYVVHAADPVAVASAHSVPAGAVAAVPVAAALVQCGLRFGPVPLLVAGDAALLERRVAPPEIDAMVHSYAHAPGMAAVRRAVPLLDPRSESVGESLLRYALHLLGWAVESQYRPPGVARRCDMLLLGTRLVVEFDGMAKFTTGRAVDTVGATQAAVRSAVTSVFDRDEELAGRGLHVLHVTWRQLLDSDGTLRLADLRRRVRTRLAAIREQESQGAG